MSTLLNIGASPAAGFDAPFDMLSACHDRVRRSLDLLQRLQAHLRSHGADTAARDAARDVLRYFSLAAPQHHEDEERHVVPALHARGDAAAARAAERIVADHVEIRAAWQQLEPLLAGLVAGTAPDAERFDRVAAAFVGVHDGHLRLEDEFAFPAAAEQVGRGGVGALRTMGDEMARRRGVVP